jgi:hypothetical protein
MDRSEEEQELVEKFAAAAKQLAALLRAARASGFVDKQRALTLRELLLPLTEMCADDITEAFVQDFLARCDSALPAILAAIDAGEGKIS